MSVAERPTLSTAPARPAAVIVERRWPWWVGLGARAGRRARPAPVGLQAGPAVRLQRRRERALRPARDRDLRAQLEPALLRQPAGLHVPPARPLRRLVRRARRAWPGARGRPDEVFVVARPPPRRSARWPWGCSTWPARGSSAAPSGSSPRRCWRSRSCRCSTRTWRSTTCRRSRRSRCRCRHRRRPARRAPARLRARRRRARAWRARRSTRAGSCSLPLLARRRASRLADRTRRTPPRAGLVLAGVVALAAFLVANPYALLDLAAFRDGLQHQADAADDARGKLGLTQTSGTCYYLWTLHLGARLGAARGRRSAALGLLAVDDAPRAARARPAPMLFVLFMGAQARFFGRWLLPVFPIACLLGASRSCAWPRSPAGGAAGARARAGRPRRRAAAAAQGLVYSLHSAMTLVARRHAQQPRATGWSPTSRRARRSSSSRSSPDQWAMDLGHPLPRAPATATAGRSSPRGARTSPTTAR